MRWPRWGLGLLLFVLLGTAARADLVGSFPGLDALIEQAQSIVILRVEHQCTTDGAFARSNSYVCYNCFVYQSLKGDVAPDKPLRLELADFHNNGFETLPEGSTWLVFLIKDGTGYRSLAVIGSLVKVSPTGQEKAPEGGTVGEKVRNVLKAAVDYRRREYEREQTYLQKLLEGKPGSIDDVEPNSK